MKMNKLFIALILVVCAATWAVAARYEQLTVGELTVTTSTTNSGTISAEQLTSTGDATVTGTINTGVGIDGVGAVDLDYGSADITDHTFTTNDCTVVIDGGVTISTGDNVVLGTTTWNSGDGIDGEVIGNDTIDEDAFDWGTGTDQVSGADFPDEDLGDVVVSSGTWSLDSDVVDEAHIADDGIDSEHYNDDSIDDAHMNFGTATNQISASDLPDEDLGDMSVATGAWTIDEDVLDKANLKDEDWGDVSVSSNSVTLDTGVVGDNEIDYTAVTGADLTLTDCGAITGTAINASTSMQIASGGTFAVYRFATAALADDGTYTFASANLGSGGVMYVFATKGSGYGGTFGIGSDASSVLFGDATNADDADTDGDLCVFDGGTDVTIKNRTGGVTDISGWYLYQP